MTYFLGLMMLFLIVRVCISLYNLITKPTIENSGGYNSYAHAPLISILVPLRNEESVVNQLCDCLNRLHYPNLEILLLNDQSTDRTLDLLNTQTFVHPTTIVNGSELPHGWLGKNWACHQLAMNAKGVYFVFMDADVMPNKELISAALQRIKKYDLDILSLFPTQEMITLGEKLIVPLMHLLLLHLLPLKLVRISKYSSLAAANGQFMMFRAEAYKRFPFHEAVKNNVLDDVNIMRLAKEKKQKVEVLLGGDLIKCRMYDGFKSAFRGFSKNLYAGFGHNIVGIITYIFLLSAGWLLFFTTAPLHIIVIAILLIVIQRAAISLTAKQKVWENLILHPIQIALYAAIAVNSIYQYYNKSTTWKGRKVNL